MDIALFKSNKSFSLCGDYIKITTTITEIEDISSKIFYPYDVRHLYVDYKNCESKYCGKCSIFICPRHL